MSFIIFSFQSRSCWTLLIYLCHNFWWSWIMVNESRSCWQWPIYKWGSAMFEQNCEQQPHSFLVTLRTGLQTQFLCSRFPLEGRLTILGQHHWRQLTIYLTISPNCFSSFVCNTSQRPISTYLKIELIQSENATRYLTNSQGSFVKDASLMHLKKGKQKIFTTQGWIYFSCSQTLLHKLNLMWSYKYSFDIVIQI